MTFSYFYRNYLDLTDVVNVAVSAADYSPITITNPLDGAPFTIYSQSAASIGRVQNVLLNSDALRQWYHGVEATVDRRFRNNLTLFGGITVGSSKAATSASNNPSDRINTSGYDLLDSTVIANFSGVYRLPWNVDISSHGAYYTGQPLRRIYTITPALVPALRQTSQDVNLVSAGEVRKPNQTLIDLRVGRRFRAAGSMTFEPLFEVYNILNENASLVEVEQVGATLGRISRNIDGRMVRLGLKVSF